jgi:hypothetical protein
MVRLISDHSFGFTFLRERASELCNGAPNLDGQLVNFTRFIVKRPLSAEQRSKEFPVQVGTLNVEGKLSEMPDGPMVVYTNRERTSVAAIFKNTAAELTTPLSFFDQLENGCTALDRPSDGHKH